MHEWPFHGSSLTPFCDIVTGLNHQHQEARAAVQRLLDLVRAAQHREALCREARHQRRAIDSHNRHGMRHTYQDTEGGRNTLSYWLSTMPFPHLKTIVRFEYHALPEQHRSFLNWAEHLERTLRSQAARHAAATRSPEMAQPGMGTKTRKEVNEPSLDN